MSQKHVWIGIATLIGTIVGAGIFGIPYAIQQAGVWTGLIMIAVLGSAITLINLMLGEVTLRTRGNHQLTGYAERYLGKWGKRWMSVSMVIGIYGALVAYTIGEAISLSEIFGGSPILWGALFYGVMAVLLFKGLRAIGESEFWLIPIYLLIFLAVAIASLTSSHFNTSALTGLSFKNILIPYGVILFSFLGTASIPEVRREMPGHWNQFKKAILIGSITPIILYAIFAVIVIATTGGQTTEIATVGLGQLLGSYALILLNALAVIALMTSFLALGLALKEMYMYDFDLKPNTAWVATMIVPLIAIFAGLQSYIGVIGFTGAFAGGIDGIIIVWMFLRAKKYGERKPEYSLNVPWIISLLLMLIFAVGAITAFIA